MKIVADPNIPFVQEAFGPLGEVRLVPGREITAGAVRDADVLLVRSVTPVNAALLDGSQVKFVATATIGIDHVDQEYLLQEESVLPARRAAMRIRWRNTSSRRCWRWRIGRSSGCATRRSG